ncbi:MAG: amidohydrolase [Clostridiales bacterium]|nr:amidohydrolase [Clostridiales bacterium]
MFEKYAAELTELAHLAWRNAEPGFREFECSRSQAAYLKKMGFDVEMDVAGTATGYEARWGRGKPEIAILGEFDALYGLGQKADVARREPEPGMEMGQGCGHHLLGVGAIAAALALRGMMAEKSLPGTIRLFGCPGEESGSGKAYMARDGVFGGCDAALTWHPSNFNMVCTGSSQSCIQCYFRFSGVAAHAAGAPHLGRSALDAVELMNVGVNYLREHMEGSDRVHYAVTDAGGRSPNVVQAFAESRYLVRSATNAACSRLYERVKLVAQGAAMMTGTQLEVVFDEGLSNTVPNFTLERVMAEAFREAGPPRYTAEERAYARQFKDTFGASGQLSDLPSAAKDRAALERNVRESELCDIFVETLHSEQCEMGSTDVGDVSWVAPTCTANVNCYSYGAGAHSWQWVAQGKSGIAIKGMLHAGKVIALTAMRLLESPAIIGEAKDELRGRLKGEHYESLIPSGVKPHYYD